MGPSKLEETQSQRMRWTHSIRTTIPLDSVLLKLKRKKTHGLMVKRKFLELDHLQFNPMELNLWTREKLDQCLLSHTMMMRLMSQRLRDLSQKTLRIKHSTHQEKGRRYQKLPSSQVSTIEAFLIKTERESKSKIFK